LSVRSADHQRRRANRHGSRTSSGHACSSRPTRRDPMTYGLIIARPAGFQEAIAICASPWRGRYDV